MSSFIKEMVPPDCCDQCIFEDLAVMLHRFGAKCPYIERFVEYEEFDVSSGRHPDCPISDVEAPHGPLVDAEEISNIPVNSPAYWDIKKIVQNAEPKVQEEK